MVSLKRRNFMSVMDIIHIQHSNISARPLQPSYMHYINTVSPKRRNFIPIMEDTHIHKIPITLPGHNPSYAHQSNGDLPYSCCRVWSATCGPPSAAPAGMQQGSRLLAPTTRWYVPWRNSNPLLRPGNAVTCPPRHHTSHGAVSSASPAENIKNTCCSASLHSPRHMVHSATTAVVPPKPVTPNSTSPKWELRSSGLLRSE